MQNFFEPMVKMVLSNCTIAGLPYLEYKKKMPAGGQSRWFPSTARIVASDPRLTSVRVDLPDTEPFKDDLHQRIVDYQNQLFEAREENVNARRTEPQRIAGVRLARFRSRHVPISSELTNRMLSHQ
jgi:hypothetical protein